MNALSGPWRLPRRMACRSCGAMLLLTLGQGGRETGSSKRGLRGLAPLSGASAGQRGLRKLPTGRGGDWRVKWGFSSVPPPPTPLRVRPRPHPGAAQRIARRPGGPRARRSRGQAAGLPGGWTVSPRARRLQQGPLAAGRRSQRPCAGGAWVPPPTPGSVSPPSVPSLLGPAPPRPPPRCVGAEGGGEGGSAGAREALKGPVQGPRGAPSAAGPAFPSRPCQTPGAGRQVGELGPRSRRPGASSCVRRARRGERGPSDGEGRPGGDAGGRAGGADGRTAPEGRPGLPTGLPDAGRGPAATPLPPPSGLGRAGCSGCGWRGPCFRGALGWCPWPCGPGVAPRSWRSAARPTRAPEAGGGGGPDARAAGGRRHLPGAARDAGVRGRGTPCSGLWALSPWSPGLPLTSAPLSLGAAPLPGHVSPFPHP